MGLERNNRKTFHPIKSDERKAEQVLHDISIHTYYYDKSILDGYTLKILREEIETSYKNKLKEIYEDLEKTDDLSEWKRRYKSRCSFLWW